MSVCHEKKKKGMLEAMSCCENGGEAPEKLEGLKRVLLVGMPNVGKSQLFNQLTGRYVTVSNYPGTTVEVTEARGEIPGLGLVRVTDTPGMYSLWGVTEEEKVTARMVLGCENVQAVVHVVDAKNIERMLGLTLQLIEAGLPVVLVLNMMDEPLAAGVTIDSAALEARLGIRVVETVATRGKGIDMLRNAILNAKVSDKHFLNIPDLLKRRVLDDPEKGAGEALDQAQIFRRISLLLGQHQEEWEKETGNSDLEKVNRQLRYELGHAPHFVLQESVQQVVNGLLSGVVKEVGKKQVDWRWRLAQFLDRLCLHPLSGAVIFLVVVYFGLYRFVGDFAAGTVVDFLESKVFEEWLIPPVDRFIKGLLPWEWLWSLFVGDYGVISLGVRYAIALIMPIVGAFFLAFSLLEDSGYLPRLAMLIDRVFKKIGLSGRAVIPIVLGFGCDTMATMVTRTLETKRERLIASLLLALTIPCSAQLGLIFALLHGHPWGVVVWGGMMVSVFLIAGALAARLFPGEGPRFFMELPPLRLPRLGNVLVKTYSRMVWYFREILPMFVIASVLIWLGKLTRLFDLVVWLLKPMVRFLGLPDSSAVAFLFGFFRRDYGAAGLYDLQKAGLLSGNQLVVAAVVLTLFLPCIAQMMVLWKERGAKTTLLITTGVLIVAFGVGILLNLSLHLLNVSL